MFFFCLFIFTAKAKLESQLESARTQELANGGQANDILKCVGFDFVLFLKRKSQWVSLNRIQFLINYLN